MTRLYICLIIFLVSFPVNAEEKRFWILGSYAKADNAHAERDRLADDLALPVEVLFDEERALFRVAVPADVAGREDLDGNDAWSLNMVVDESRAQIPQPPPQPAAEPSPPLEEPSAAPADDNEIAVHEPQAPTTQRQPPAVAEPEPRALYPAFRERESLSEYCARLPETSLCMHPKTREVLEKDRRLSGYRSYSKESCDQIIDDERRQTCLDMF